MLDLTQMNVLVTGGAGFIGCAVSELLAKRCGRFVALDVLHPQVHPERTRPVRLHEAAELVVADITDESVWDRCLRELRADLVIHLAAETGTAQSLAEASRHASVNVLGTTRMLDAFSRAGHLPQAIVVCSSRAVYGEGRWRRSDGTVFYPGQRSHAQLESGQWDFPDALALPSSCETTRPSPTSVYGATKLAQEHILSAWCAARDVSLRVLRLQNVYGPGQSLANSYTGIVSLFSQLARSGRSIPVYEDGRITRDFVFIEDVARAIEAAVTVESGLDICVDVGSGAATSLHDLADEIARLRQAPSPVVNGMFRDGDVRHASCSIDAARAVLGWHPTWTLGDGLDALQKWIDSELNE